MKLLRTIRLDPSDTFVFEKAAEPGEWAVSGAFEFWDEDLDNLAGKRRAAFRAGFLGVESLGRSTLVQIVEAKAQDREALVEALAKQLVDRFDAPDMDTARAAAEEEIQFVESLCEYPPDMLVAVHRTVEDGAIREAFRSLQAKGGPKPLRAFSFLEVQGDEESEERVDLVGLAEGKPK